MTAETLLAAWQSAESLTRPSLRADQSSAWHGHVSFGHWIVEVTRPRVVVELGAHNGVSYAAFLNSVASTGLSTRCFAVDTWEGDAHAGRYGEQVYSSLAAFNADYSTFSTLLRCYFDDAIDQFEDGAVDLLHIDGLHTYDAVRHDFESWRAKLSSRAIVLFHDTEVHAADFGVDRFWKELGRDYKTFSFTHSYGLGVLAFGDDVPNGVRELLDCEDAQAERIKRVFEAASHSARLAGLDMSKRSMLDRMRNWRAPGVNIALNKQAFQSSSRTDRPMTPMGAVNGLKNGHYGFHTAHEDAPWWMVDLGKVQKFDEIVIYNRLAEDCIGRARSIKILASDNCEDWRPIYEHDGSVFGGIDGRFLRVECVGALGRFVKLKLDGSEFFHLDEVEIYRH